jgi:hypothetical protein
MVLKKENLVVRLQSVADNSLGELYGLRKDDILCKPSMNGELDQDIAYHKGAMKCSILPP